MLSIKEGVEQVDVDPIIYPDIEGKLYYINNQCFLKSSHYIFDFETNSQCNKELLLSGSFLEKYVFKNISTSEHANRFEFIYEGLRDIKIPTGVNFNYYIEKK